MLRVPACCSLVALSISLGSNAHAQPLTTVRIVPGLTHPTAIAAPAGDAARLFIAQQPGSIRIIDLTANPPVLLAAAFLDIHTLVNYGGEQGMLGLAFDPDYASNGYFYVDYNSTTGSNTIARYTVSSDPNVADSASGVILKTITHGISNHNAGCIQFGLDGYLYIAQGDAGNSANAQATGTLLGKMLRLDVHNPPNYIPATNPFVGPGDPLDEIWALGLRNPWRFSFDRLTGDLYIADVGAGSREEVNFTPAGSSGGENYGWRCYEGSIPYVLTGCLPASNYQFPIYDYAHAGNGCAVMGGFVYRGSAVCWLRGSYFFADYCTNKIWTFRVVNGAVTEFTQRNVQFAPGGGLSIASISTFGEDAAGELYIADLSGGEIFKIVPSTALLNIISADPPNNYLDPREDMHAGASAGLSTFTATLPNSNGGYCPSDITLNCSGGTPCPSVTGVTMTADGVFSVSLSGPIPPGYCTRFTFAHTAEGPSNPLTYRFLPGDVNGSGTSNTQDLLALANALATGATTLSMHDINRDGAVNTADLLRLAHLLNGTNTSQVWNGVSLICSP
ncbi:MAG TPA: PQQ-dependent sugar dehydrogenase [Phycisphaerae bacterium]